MYRLQFILLLALAAIFFGLGGPVWSQSSLFESYSDEEFRSYWYSDNAELTHYSLSQARYGELREGNAVMIFVSEPMNTRLQVKADAPYEGKKIRDVLKLNFTKNFYTGIYPYSVMTSVFTPVDKEDAQRPEKVSLTIQEWCGQVFAQLNLSKGRYKVKSFSYFENEADKSFSLKNAVTEDGLWNLMRIAPNDLPTGDFLLIPSLAISRLKHIELRPEKVTASLKAGSDGSALYTVDFLETDRTLSVWISRTFPYEISGWEETFVSGWGDKAARLTTKAEAVERINLDYWRKNSEADSVLRTQLGLE